MIRVFFDSSFWVARYRQGDAHEKDAHELLKSVSDVELYTNNLVIYETLTVLSQRAGKIQSLKFGRYIFDGIDDGNLYAAIFDEAPEHQTWKIFQNGPHKAISFVDCSILATIKEYRIDALLSFDKDFKQFQQPYKFKLNAL